MSNFPEEREVSDDDLPLFASHEYRQAVPVVAEAP
jgi:hypothetical protein